MPYLVAATVLLFGIFYLVYRHNRARVLNGLLFLAFLLSAGFTYIVFVAQWDNPILNFTLIGIAFVALGVLLFGVYILIALLLLNARVVFKRERRSLANSLTLILGLGLIAVLVVSAVVGATSPPLWVQALWSGLIFVLLFYLLHVFLFLTSLLLCNLARPPKKQDYIVVLGCGLVDGKVTKLLASRIDRALKFYHKQAAVRTPPKLVMSGGQGPDEPMPEAEAMRQYALARHIPAERILVEDKSASTGENLRFSKQLMDADTGGRPYRCIFATSGYHLLRAGILARQAGLDADGIGGKTAWYYRPNALLREYFAFFWMHRVGMFITIAVLFLLGACLRVLPDLIARHIASLVI